MNRNIILIASVFSLISSGLNAHVDGIECGDFARVNYLKEQVSVAQVPKLITGTEQYTQEKDSEEKYSRLIRATSHIKFDPSGYRNNLPDPELVSSECNLYIGG
jgi:hypothetical protein